MKPCPKCGNALDKWYLLGGKARWECPGCNYKEEIE